MAAKKYFNSTTTRWENGCMHIRQMTKNLAILYHMSALCLVVTCILFQLIPATGKHNTLDYHHQLHLYTSRYNYKPLSLVQKRTVTPNSRMLHDHHVYGP